MVATASSISVTHRRARNATQATSAARQSTSKGACKEAVELRDPKFAEAIVPDGFVLKRVKVDALDLLRRGSMTAEDYAKTGSPRKRGPVARLVAVVANGRPGDVPAAALAMAG